MIQNACSLGIGVQGEVVEELKVGVQHDADVGLINCIAAVELPLGGSTRWRNILK